MPFDRSHRCPEPRARLGGLDAVRVGLVALASPLLLSARALADDAASTFDTGIFSGVSTPAIQIQTYSLGVVAICAAIFVVVVGFGAWTVIRFRRRDEDDDREPPQIYGSNSLELAWTVIPLVIVFILALVTARANDSGSSPVAAASTVPSTVPAPSPLTDCASTRPDVGVRSPLSASAATTRRCGSAPT